MALPTAATIRGRVLGQISGTAIDGKLDDLIVAADAVLAAYCMFPEYAPGLRTMESHEYTSYFKGPARDDSRILPLRIRPVSAVTSVACDSLADWTYAEPWTEDVDFVLEPESGKLLRPPNGTKAWRYGLRAIKVVYTAGFDVASNETLVEAIALLISHWFQFNTAPVSVQQYTMGSQSASIDSPKGLPNIVKDLVSPFVLWERQEHGWR